MKKILLGVFILAGLQAQAKLTPDSVVLDLGASYGTINGFVQIPKGGAIGTTDYHKPTFDQMGLNENIMYNANIELNYGKWSYFSDFRMGNLNKTFTLDEPLLTHGIQLNTGNEYKLDTPIQYISIGAKREYMVTDKLTISPIVALDVEILNYTWSATSDSKDIFVQESNTYTDSVDDTRGSFHFFAPSVGMEINYYFTENTYLEVEGKGIIPIGNSWKYYFYGSAKLNHEFYTNDDSYLNGLTGYVGVESYASKTRDGQSDFQNWVEMRGTMLTTGIKIKFK